LPPVPGVYVMRDHEGRIIYVGKTRNLASRVRSYFRSMEDRPAKISRILDRLYDLRCVPVGSDLEAILVEARMIRTEEPEVNVQRKVHPRPGKRRGERNMIVVCPSAEVKHAEVFLLAEGRALGQVRVRRDLKDLLALREALAEAYSGSAPDAPLAPEEEEDLRLAWSYFRRHRDSLEWVNADHAGGRRDLLRRVKEAVRRLEGESL